MPTPLVKTAMAKMPSTRFRQGYGMTEAAPLLTILDYEDHFGDAIASAGKPVFGTEVRVVDDFDRDVAVGEVRRNHRARREHDEGLLETS